MGRSENVTEPAVRRDGPERGLLEAGEGAAIGTVVALAASVGGLDAIEIPSSLSTSVAELGIRKSTSLGPVEPRSSVPGAKNLYQSVP